MRHLTDSGAEGAPIRDLLQVLPALSRNQVKRLLKELALEGRAQIIGATRAGRWFAAGSTGQIGSAGDDDPTNAPKKEPIRHRNTIRLASKMNDLSTNCGSEVPARAERTDPEH